MKALETCIMGSDHDPGYIYSCKQGVQRRTHSSFFFEGHRCNLDAQLFSVGENSIYGVRPDSSIENIKISVCTYSRLYTGNQSSYYLTP